MSEPKYQATRMWGEYNFTVRADTYEEFLEELANVKPLIDGIKAGTPTTTASAKPAKEKAGWCDYHKCDMFYNKNGKLYHMDNTRNEGDKFCNGRGFQSEFEAWSKKKAATQHNFDSVGEVEEALTEEPEEENIADEIPF